MDHAEVPVSKAAATPMDDIAEGIRGLRLGFVNVFGVEHANGSWTLIDAGIPYSAGRIRPGPRKPSAPAQRHRPHPRPLRPRQRRPRARRPLDVPVYAHPAEFPLPHRPQEYPAPNPAAGGGIMSLLSPLYPAAPSTSAPPARCSPRRGHRALPRPAPRLDPPPHPRPHPRPRLLLPPTDHTLLVGDAFCTTKPESFFDAAVAQPARAARAAGLLHLRLRRRSGIHPPALPP